MARPLHRTAAANTPSRRDLLRAAAATALGSNIAKAAADAGLPASGPTGNSQPFYYVDGYHGGVDGHMPPDSLRNVMDGLDKFPAWKVSFEIEPYSWARFAASDPAATDRLRRFLADPTPAARVELVSGMYAQPYAWNVGGECVVRHLMYGRAAIAAAFPGVAVDTYAVQEPCWTSCLPQLLRSFGYRRAVLKNSTGWGGYHAPTADADLVAWAGPDGSTIPAVPRYACERAEPPATVESAKPTKGFIDRCRAAGIAHPAGGILQDMGWPGRPWRLGIAGDVYNAFRHTTWREYAETIAAPLTLRWKASQEDLRVVLAWGASSVQRIARAVRAAENRLVQAEKLASIAVVRGGGVGGPAAGAFAYPADALQNAWHLLLRAQHHDAWIVPFNGHRERGTWASRAVE
ncbi:MAG: glycosyl hydrolase 38 domain protein, partial [Phycisphaerales bacterium]|nr:glycosyl hydrolase 38 domain protein [Phycisphaerales bacterium]